jgi:hypothetical protein
MRAYPTSFRQILDLVAANGLDGDELKPGQTVPWPAWDEQARAARRQPGGGGSGGGAREVSAAAAGAGAAAEQAGSSSGGGGGDEEPPSKVQVVLVGATVTEAEVEEAVARHWVTEPVVVRVGAPGRVPSGLRHRALVVADAGRALAALVAMLRRDLEQGGEDEEPARVSRRGGGAAGLGALGRRLRRFARGRLRPRSQRRSLFLGGAAAFCLTLPPHHPPPPPPGTPPSPHSQVIVFASSDAAARAAADPLRTALWSEHQLSVLLPSGAEPIKALQAFRCVGEGEGGVGGGSKQTRLKAGASGPRLTWLQRPTLSEASSVR